MRFGRSCAIVVVGLAASGVVAVHLDAQEKQQQPVIKMPQPGVPQIMTLEGKFVRVAYNNEGYVIMGYQTANRSLGSPWILLEVGMTVRDGVDDFKLKRDAISLSTPDGQTVPLPSIEEYRKANDAVQPMQQRERVQRDSIDYFPPSVNHGCRLGFFSDLEDRAMPWDQVELSHERGCLGRLYFPVPGGIKYGQYWLNVKFAKSLVRVPFKILTEKEEELLGDHFDDIKKQIDNAFRKKG